MDRVTLCDAGRGASPGKCWKGEIMKIVVPPNEDFGKAVAMAASTHDGISTDINSRTIYILSDADRNFFKEAEKFIEFASGTFEELNDFMVDLNETVKHAKVREYTTVGYQKITITGEYLLQPEWVLEQMENFYPGAHIEREEGSRDSMNLPYVMLEDHDGIQVWIYKKCIMLGKVQEDWHTDRGEAFVEVLKDEILRVTGFPCDPRRGHRDDVYYLL